MWYKNVGTGFFHFVTIYAFDRQMDISLLAKTALHMCSAVKVMTKHLLNRGFQCIAI